MTVKHIRTGLITAVLSLFICISAFGQDTDDTIPDLVKLMQRVEQSLNSLVTLTCEFEHIQYVKEADYTRSYKGGMQIKPPYLYRVELHGKTMYIDGEAVYFYFPKNNQVQINTFVKGDESLPTPHGIFERYARNSGALYEGTEMINGVKAHRVELTIPDNPGGKVLVWLDDELAFPVKSVEESPEGDVTTYVLSGVKLNETIEDSVFTFDIPDSVEVIDMREDDEI